MSRRIGEIIRTIRFKLLASLLLLLALSIGVSLFGIWSYERDRYREIAEAEARRAARTVEQSLRQAMLINDWGMIRRSVADIYQIVAPTNLGIISNSGKVLVSGAPAMEGRIYDRNREPECAVCHLKPGLPPRESATFLTTAAGPILRNVIKLENSAECQICHGPEQRNLGILFYDAPFGEIFAMLQTVLTRTLLTGTATFLLVTMVLSLIIRRYVHRPLQALEEGFNHAGRGDFNYWVEVEAEGEIQDMAVQFNVMSQAVKRSFAEIKRKNWETEQLYAFVRRLSSETEWHQLRRMIIDLLYETFQTERMGLLLRREHQEGIWTEISWREEGDRRHQNREYLLPPPSGELPGWLELAWAHWRAAPHGKSAFSADSTIALASLTTHSVSLGLICLQRQSDHPFDEMDKKLLTAVGEQIEIALANARLYRLAITDGLTGLYSKRYCQTAIGKFIEKHAVDPGRVFSVLMLDLDHFKQVNDTHGHQVGDQVLTQLAELIRQGIRQDDIACRYGGEEFIVLVTGAIQNATQIAERICRSVGEQLFSCANGLELHNTISIGVASFPDHGRTAEKIIGAADRALYEAKSSGRNRVAVFAGKGGQNE